MGEWAVLAVLGGVSLACALHLWMRARGSIGHKLAWTPLVLVPVIGPLFYGAWYAPPSSEVDGSDLGLDDINEDAADIVVSTISSFDD